MQLYLVTFGDYYGVYGEQEGILHVLVDDDAPTFVMNYAITYRAAGRSIVLV